MFKNISMTGTGIIVTLIESIFQLLGIDVPGGSVGSAVEGIVAVVGLVLIVVGQVRRKDLVAGIVRK